MASTFPRSLARFSSWTSRRSAPGPTCTRILADLGAGVLRVERAAPMTGEPTRDVLGPLGYAAAPLDALLAEGVIEQYKGETP